MYQAFYGFQEKPFSLFPDQRFLFLNRRYKLALSLLEFGLLNHNGMIVLTGDPGTGKTTLLQKILSLAESSMIVGTLTFTHGRDESLLPWILRAYGVSCSSNELNVMFEAVSEFFSQVRREGKGLLLVVDEAQNLAVEKLEDLRLVFNLNEREGPVFQVLLAGHTQLRDQLKDSRLSAFRQRIGTDFSLEPLNAPDTVAYIRHRVQAAGGRVNLFSDSACEMVYRLTGGNPRLINQLCETSLVYGFSDQASLITEGLVLEAAQDRQDSGLFIAVQDELPMQATQEDCASEIPDVEKASPAISDAAPESIPDPFPQPAASATPADPQRYWEEGQEFMRGGWFAEAIRSFKEAAESPECHFSSWFQVALCYMELRRYSDALEALETALSSSSNMMQSDRLAAQHAMGCVLEWLGQTDQASACFDLIRKTAPDYSVRSHEELFAILERNSPKKIEPTHPIFSWIARFFGLRDTTM